MARGTSRRDNYRRVASYVDKILKGAEAADLPWSGRRSWKWWTRSTLLAPHDTTAADVGRAAPRCRCVRAFSHHRGGRA